MEDSGSKTMLARLNRLHAPRSVEELHLQPDQRIELLTILARPEDSPGVAEFIANIETEIAAFRVVHALDAETKAAADARNTLKRLATALRKLSDELEDMPDQHSDAYLRLSLGLQSKFCLVPPTPPEPPPWNPDWQHVGVSFGGPPGSVETFISLLLRDLQALEDATARAREIGKNDAGGQRVKTAQTFLARDVAQAFREHLKVEPTTTVEGQFERVLRFCLKASGEYVGDGRTQINLHTLVMKTLTATKSTN